MADLSAKLVRVARFIESMSREDRRWFKIEEASIRQELLQGLESSDAEKLVPACIGAYEAWFALQESERNLAQEYAQSASNPDERVLLLVHALVAGLRMGDEDLEPLVEELESLRDEVLEPARSRAIAVAIFTASQADRDDEVEQLALRCNLNTSAFARDTLAMHAINRGQRRRALALIDLSMECAARDGDDVWMARSLIRLSHVPGLPIADSVDVLRQVGHLARRSELASIEFWVRLEQARLCLLSGNLDEAKEHAQWVVEVQPEFAPMPHISAMCQIRLGDVLLASGDTSLAAQAYGTGLRQTGRASSKRLRSRLVLRNAVAVTLADSPNADPQWPQQDELEGLQAEEIFAWEQLVRTQLAELQTSAALESNPAWDVRIARHILALRQKIEAEVMPAVTWNIDADLSAIEIEGGATVRFRKRSPKRAIMKRLVDAARKDREGRVATHELIEAGWPTESFVGDSARGRLWTTLHRLRLDGLEQIESSPQGYRIAQNVLVVFK